MKATDGMERYTTLAGETVEYRRPEPALAAFLARVVDAAHDPGVTESAMIDLLYGPENPLLDTSIIPGRGVVTKAAFEHPVYRVLQDLLGRKRVQVGTLDLAASDARHTVSVTEAAERLGVHPSAVRQALQTGRLAGRKVGGTWLTTEEALASFRVVRRGPRPGQKGGTNA